MDRLVKKYAAKLVSAGLADPREHRSPIIGGMDDELIWNRKGPENKILERVFDALSITALVFLRPAPPYDTLLSELARIALESRTPIEPKDCETRTFLHDLPVVETFDAAAIIKMLKHRKSVVVASTEPGGRPSPAVITYGTVSPEQGFVVASSVCFAGFVKFFSDYLQSLRCGTATQAQHAVFDLVAGQVPPLDLRPPHLESAPYSSEAQVCRAMAEAGRQTVAYNLVDSYFGNISFHWQDTLYISQTGSSLDELEGCIDPVALDGSSSAGLTASSELSAHLETIARTGCRALIHGHPKFAVILSMDCDPAEQAACRFSDQCHINCPRPRFVEDIPIVPGEVGTGPTGLCHTLPPALEHHPAAIVYGHGLFAVGKEDFGKAFNVLLGAEGQCREIYFETVRQLRRKASDRK
jgi:ribulose-5-phosphate 4-epimerase/fuculose-1-phosphate aldolase